MNTNKFLIGGIIGGIVFFLLGYLVYGMLLKDFMASNMGTATGAMKPMDEIVWWALIVGNILSGLVLSFILSKAGVSSAGAGAGVGFVASLLITAAFDFTWLGVSNVNSLKGSLVDIVASAVMGAIVGAVIGWYLGMGKKAVA